LKNDNKISDVILISAVRKDDHLAFDRLFHRYGPILYSFVLSIIKDESESEEVVQDIFLKVWEKRKELQLGLSFKSYLFTIAVNATRKIYRQKLQNSKYKQEIAIELGHDRSTDLSTVEYKNLLDYVERIIDRLPPSRREIFIMSRKDGLKNAEIAKILSISEQTVKNQLVSAHKFLIAEAGKDRNELGFLFLSLFFRF
jgi:RNA polymerase sigma-70 factor (ECF subfamily)